MADLIDSILEGCGASSHRASTLEKLLKDDENNLPARCELIGYYGHNNDIDNTRKLGHHILWFIKNRPEEDVLDTRFLHINTIRHGIRTYEQGKYLWLLHHNSAPSNLKIIRHAAAYFLLESPSFAKYLLLEGERIDNRNPYWPERLAHLYSLHARKNDSSRLNELKMGFNIAPDDEKIQYQLKISQCYFDLGQFDLATNHATEVATQIDQSNRIDNNDLFFQTHCLLARLCLFQKDLKQAKVHIDLAATVEGSPVLDSFGPDLDVVDDLLDLNEVDLAISFLKECLKFGRSEYTLSCIGQIKEGKRPKLSYSGYLETLSSRSAE